jgi:hypothetical protein
VNVVPSTGKEHVLAEQDYKIADKAMGKRELIIALAFVVIGVVAYQLTAPPPKPGEEPFSISRLWNLTGGRMRGNNAHATLTKNGTVPVSAESKKLRLLIMGSSRQIRVIGESRTDIRYEMDVEATGPDRATATNYAEQVVVKADDLGNAITLRVDFPRAGRQSVALTIHLPSRLGIMVGGAGVDASNVASLHLDNVTGESRITSIAGELTGTYRNGSLEASGVLGGAKLSLQRTRASFQNVQHGLTLDVRDGECRLTGITGAVEIDEARADITVKDSKGPVRITGSDGSITLDHPTAEATVDTRRAEVEAQVSQAVPLTLLTTDDTLRLLIDGRPNISVDAATTLGQIQAADFDLQAETVDQDARLAHNFGSTGGARVSLRNVRGNIVIKNFRGPIVNRNRK